MTENIDTTIEKVDGSTITRTGLVDQMITYYKQAYQEELTDICDISEGSEIRTLLESIAVDLYDIYYYDYEMSKQKFVKYATGQFLDLLGCEAHLTRQSSTAAEGQVTFSISQVISSSYTIPSGTIILHKETGYQYVLRTSVTIAAGSTSAVGNVISKYTGQKYNCDANMLTAFSNPSSVRRDLKVTNNNEITGGSDSESDTDFRQRILDAKKERAYGTVTSYETLLRDIDEVHDVQFVNPENVNHYITDQSGNSVRCTDCTRVVYVNADSKPCPDDVLEQVEYQLSLQSNLVIGHEFHVEAADLANLYFYVSLYTEDGVDSVSQSSVVEAILAYIDGGTVTKDADTSKTYPGLNIKESVEKRRLIEAIEYVSGVDQVDHIMRMKYNTGLPTDTKYWTKVSDTTYNYTDSSGYTYSRQESVNTIDYWGTLEFTSIDLRSGRVANFARMSEVDGYDSSEDDETGVEHQIKLDIL